MSAEEYCTLYCKRIDYPRIPSIVSELDLSVKIAGSSKKWRSVLARGKTGSIRINSMVFNKAGDEFSKLQRQTYVCFEGSRSRSKKKTIVLDHILATQMMLGVVARQGFDADERYHELVLRLRRA